MTRLYDKKLSEIFTDQIKTPSGVFLRDKHKQNFGWQCKKTKNKSKKLFYAIGCSWIQSIFFNRVFLNYYPDYIMINRAIGGQGNSMIIDILKRDIDFINSIGKPVEFLVSFSEVGRNQKDFYYVNPSEFSNTHDYFGEILKQQYLEVEKLLKNNSNYITTSWVPNNFNDKKTILDFCGDSVAKKPIRDVFHYHSGIHSYMRDKKIFNHFDHLSAVEETITAIQWVSGHEHVDETMHVKSYKPYEDFLSHVFSTTENSDE